MTHCPLAAAVQNFLGGVDEEWFRLVHVAIEAAAAPAIAVLQPLQQAAAQVTPFQPPTAQCSLVADC